MNGPRRARSPAASIVVIGVGNTFRRDDGVGAHVVAALGQRFSALVEQPATLVELDGEPTRIVDAWSGARAAFVVDATRPRGRAGRVRRLVASSGRSVGGAPPPGEHRGGGTHGGGVAEAVALGRALGRLPDRLVIYGIEAADTTDGCGLSPAVAAAAATVVERLADELIDPASPPGAAADATIRTAPAPPAPSGAERAASDVARGARP